MKKTLLMLASSGLVLVLGTGNLLAQEEEDSGAAAVEIYACKYQEGMGPADLDKVTAKWNKWADDHELTDYAAWALTPFFSGPEQDFDVLWLGVTPTGAAMGAGLDTWIAHGGELAAEFDKVAACDAHGMYAAVEFKEPPKREDSSQVIISFSDCSIGEGKSFAKDVAPALTGWAEFRASHGSTAGIWALFPVYGSGGEEFDFKYVTGHGNLEEQGKDFDAWDGETARELFPMGLLECDSSRVYIARSLRKASDSDE